MIINNLQPDRKSKEIIVPFFRVEFPDARIVISNHGWIVIPKNTLLGVFKFYHDKKIYQQELCNLRLLEEARILTPKIYTIGERIIGGLELSFIQMENVRIQYPKITDIRELESEEISYIISSIHALDSRGMECYIHGNIHPSNFFRNENGVVGVFDLAGMLYGAREYDFALLYIHGDYDDIFLNSVLSSYNHRKLFSYKRFYGYVMQILIEKIRSQQPIHDEGIIGLRLALHQVINKYQSCQ